MNAKFILLWKHLYANITTSQIEKALKQAGLTHADWMDFLEFMNGVDKDDKTK